MLLTFEIFERAMNPGKKFQNLVKLPLAESSIKFKTYAIVCCFLQLYSPLLLYQSTLASKTFLLVISMDGHTFLLGVAHF